MLSQLPSSCSSIMHGTTSPQFTTLIIICIASFSQMVHALALQPQLVQAHDGGCIPAERAALLSFKKSITNDGAHALTSWHGQDCCRWRGVDCSNRTGHVIKLHLRRNTVLNPDDGDYYDGCAYAKSLFGEISPSLLSLKDLEHMDLSMNCLLGPTGHIPQFLGSMENLKYINLSGIPFTGRVPSHLGNLSKLQHLDLGQVDYSGLSSTDITWLTKLPLLQHLSMSGIDLSMIADWLHTLNMIPSLRVINIAACSLDTASQTLPYLNLTKLEKLDLSYNNLDHSISSSWFWKVTSLKYLSLRQNQLFGKFPDALGNMTSLKVLDLSDNNLNKTGNLKNLLINLCHLEILDLSYNSMNGDIVVLMEGLQCPPEKLQELHFSENKFMGTLPNVVGEFSSLNILDMCNNNLVGLIPLGLWNLVRLTYLDLSMNQLNGNVPTEIGALTALTYLVIFSNNLTGSIPAELGKLKHLTILSLKDNKITGPIPPEVTHLTSLTTLDLSSNHLNGSVPNELGYLKNMVGLDLSNNNLSGVITEEHFANLKSLKGIDLSSNSLRIVVDSDWHSPFSLQFADFASCQIGPLFPAWLQQLRGITHLDISSTGLVDKFPGWFWYTFSQATYLNMSNNQISGSLPAHLDSMALEELYLSSNRLTGSIPSLLTNITILDISKNNFSGVIPSNFEAPWLQVLIIYSNRIGGYIPESLCKLQKLVYVDLSNNSLEGEIPLCFPIQKTQFLLLSNNSLSGKLPTSLQNNTAIKFLDLSWNKLSGRLPSWIGDLGNLCFLLLSHNTFSGNIPINITSLGHLQYLDLSCNNFSGAIPGHLSNLTLMKIVQTEFMYMDDVHDSGDNSLEMGVGHLGEILSVVTKGQQLLYGTTLAYFVSIDLSGNSLTGEIPTGVTSLAALMNLNLSSNKLSGPIPDMIGAMRGRS
ncbi:receptor-like protein EIX1 [Triticum aestivum]|uniref:receptor-like protein EIX1 n=1 Tax=Triticum aestivum TaxID=4565 RepID=UPI001D0042E4|nr:receptor-like protein EIX1 [Triticum aestivum]